MTIFCHIFFIYVYEREGRTIYLEVKQMIYCENAYCNYWKKEACMLDEVALGTLGQCVSCILADIDEDVVEASRQRYRESYEKADF